MNHDIQHVFLVGAKNLGTYGGYETFINKLTEYHQHCKDIQYHVACKANGLGAMDESQLSGVTNIQQNGNGETEEFIYHNARCFKIHVPNIGPAQAVYYDLAALWKCCKYIEHHQIPHPVVYIMACRIGFFAAFFYRWIHRLGGKLYINPDGHEWMRAKWNWVVRKYWKISEQIMVRYSDLAVCDSVNIEKYIHACYDGKGLRTANPVTTYISYGAEIQEASPDSDTLLQWYTQHNLSARNYYLIVGRFVPENNFETMIREFMASSSSRSLVIIANANVKFQQELDQQLHFQSDPRIKLVGSVYDQKLLAMIRKNAFAYLHGHEVGGTNPSLLEALGATDLNLLLDVAFNREVADTAALYWSKQSGALAALVDACDSMKPEEISAYGVQAKERIAQYYSWQFISDQYHKLFCSGNTQNMDNSKEL